MLLSLPFSAAASAAGTSPSNQISDQSMTAASEGTFDIYCDGQNMLMWCDWWSVFDDDLIYRIDVTIDFEKSVSWLGWQTKTTKNQTLYLNSPYNEAYGQLEADLTPYGSGTYRGRAMATAYTFDGDALIMPIKLSSSVSAPFPATFN
ncbi:hypothetical protein [Paenibacillus xerothermodurans]|uniref:hypothetical protein n=1 Tax=Paenibacillus xerothermodurans TaxID=1977292 RepID=UPI001057FF16|nr:hypothetical protein [Paenibacillus xerothermodurans]